MRIEDDIMHKLKFTGTHPELKKLLAKHGICGTWYPEPNGVHMMRYRSGANLHWASTKGTVWIDGKRSAAARLEWRVGDALGQPVPR